MHVSRWAEDSDSAALVRRSALHVLGAALKAHLGSEKGLRRGGIDKDGTVFYDGEPGTAQQRSRGKGKAQHECSPSSPLSGLPLTAHPLPAHPLTAHPLTAHPLT